MALLVLFGFLLGGLVAARRSAAPVRSVGVLRPNLLLITLDTTRADRLGCYGGSPSLTPNIDRFAAGAALFEHAFAVAPTTLPAHTSLLTGRYPNRHGVTDNMSFRYDGKGPNLAPMLKRGGYATAAFVSAAVLARPFGLDQGFDVYDDALPPGKRIAGELIAERRGDATVTAALAWIDGRGGNAAPWFAWIHLYDPHFPYQPPEPYGKRFAGRSYDGEIAFTDAQVGRVLAHLETLGEREQTMVVIAGDHGESLGEHGERTHGVFIYQSTMHVPLLIAGPGIPARRVAWPVSQVDVLPTLAAGLGLSAPAGVEGVSQLAALRSGTAPPPRILKMESRLPFHSYRWAELFGAVAWPWKFILAPESELYDLADNASVGAGFKPAPSPGNAETHNFLNERKAEARPLAVAARAYRDASVGGASRPHLDAAQEARLRSLGYTGGRATAAGATPPDPKAMVDILGEIDRAQGFLQAGEPRQALEALSRIVARNPENWPALGMMADAHLALGDSDKALAAMSRALAVNPSDGMFYNRGVLERKAGDDAAGERDFQAALALNPGFAPAQEGLASIETTRGARAAASGEWIAAEAAFRKAVGLDVRAREAWINLANLLYQTNRHREAAAAYEKALAIETDVATLLTAGSVYDIALGDSRRAAELYRAALLRSRDEKQQEEIRAAIAEIEHRHGR